jgi:hypothetical protein
MEKNVCIVHFNTPELTNATVRSILKHTSDCRITIFDNSDKEPFIPMTGVNVLDNTKGQIIDFNEFLSHYPNRTPTMNDWGSAKHCYSIQKLWDYFPEGFVLMDSDVLVKKDISEFFDRRLAYIGTVYSNPTRIDKRIPRLYPFLCWINVAMCRANGVEYFDGTRNWKLYPGKNKYYDTGASFIEDCRKKRLPGKELDINEYIVHFGRASVIRRGEWSGWLEENKSLYE